MTHLKELYDKEKLELGTELETRNRKVVSRIRICSGVRSMASANTVPSAQS